MDFFVVYNFSYIFTKYTDLISKHKSLIQIILPAPKLSYGAHLKAIDL